MRKSGYTDLQIRAVANQLSKQAGDEIKEALQTPPNDYKIRMYVCMDPMCSAMNHRANYIGKTMRCLECGSPKLQAVIMGATKNEYEEHGNLILAE